MPAPADVQDAFARALLDPEQPAPEALATGANAQTRGFDIYRNNRMSALIDALATTYPAIQRLVGETFFRAAAKVYIGREPPRSPILHQYGESFGDFLDGFSPAGMVPYLGDVARLEWSWLCAYHAPDRASLTIQSMASIAAEETPRVKLRLHPSLSLHRSRWPIGSLWAAVCGAGDGPALDMTRCEDVLVVRPALEVKVHVVPDGAHAFISALGDGATIEEATRRAAAECEQFDLVTQLQDLFALGAVAAIDPLKEEEE